MLTVGRKSEKVSVAHSLGPTTPGRSARILQSASGADEVGDRNCIAALGLLGHGMRHGIGTRHGTAPRHWDGLSHASQGDASAAMHSRAPPTISVAKAIVLPTPI
eukprot:Polyplicarium_translucidae@DN2868_c1_g1_i3.p1